VISTAPDCSGGVPLGPTLCMSAGTLPNPPTDYGRVVVPTQPTANGACASSGGQPTGGAGKGIHRAARTK
jgi:hypothetical protein